MAQKNNAIKQKRLLLVNSFNLMKSNIFGYNTHTIGVMLILIIGIFFFKDGILNILTWDTMGYNSYLPLIFENHSFHVQLDYFEEINNVYENTTTLYQYVDLPNGNVFIKYTMGWAVLYTPFYLIAELWANWAGFPNDGFSYPYQVMSFFGTFFYIVLSIYLLRKVLLLYFNDRLATTLLLILVLGTNFFHMSYIAKGITHNLVFMLVCFFLLMNHNFYKNTSVKNALLLGFSIGMIALTRTPSVVITVFSVFYGYKQFGGTIFSKIRYFLRHKSFYVGLIIIATVITFLPQIIYWKTTTGSYFINSYANNPGEGMDWFTPYIKEILFSFKAGWLIYTPIMIFAVLGFVFWIKRDRSTGIAGVISFLAFLYVVSCWTSWWYSGYFGHRAMLDIYPVLIVSLGFFLLEYGKKWVYIIIVSLVALNLFQTYQLENKIINSGLMTKEYYFSTFLQLSKPTQEQLNLLEIDELNVASSKIDITKFSLVHEDSLSWNDFLLSQQNIYAPGMRLKLASIKDVRNLLVRSEWRYIGTPAQLEGKIFNTHMYYKDQAYGWRGSNYKDLMVTHDSIGKVVVFDYLAPNLRTKDDEVYIGLWAQSGDSIVIPSLKVSIYEWDPRGVKNKK